MFRDGFVRINGEDQSLIHLLINGVYWGYSHLDVPLLGLLGWIHGGRIISAEDSPTYTKWGRYLGVKKTLPRISLLGCCRKLHPMVSFHG